MGETLGVGAVVRLRPILEADLADVLRLLWDPDAAGEYQWFGFRMDVERQVGQRWRDDGLISEESSYLAVETDEGACAGWVTWRQVGSAAKLEIGIALFPEHRGHGLGTESQRQLVAYLFATTPVHRLQAGTELDNVAEQRALEAVGFRREGVHRGVYFRDGRWRDSVMYGLTRDDVAE